MAKTCFLSSTLISPRETSISIWLCASFNCAKGSASSLASAFCSIPSGIASSEASSTESSIFAVSLGSVLSNFLKSEVERGSGETKRRASIIDLIWVFSINYLLKSWFDHRVAGSRLRDGAHHVHYFLMDTLSIVEGSLAIYSIHYRNLTNFHFPAHTNNASFIGLKNLDHPESTHFKQGQKSNHNTMTRYFSFKH